MRQDKKFQGEPTQNCKLLPVKPSLRIYHHLPPAGQRSPCALTIGNFDGVHRGHQAILARVREAAQQRGLTPSVMTFEPHPREYFAQLHQRPELAPTRISGLRDKVASLARAGMAQILIEPFDARLAEMSANAFIEDLLVAGLQTRWLLVGEDFRFGHKRSGDIDLLREAGLAHGFEVATLADVTDRQGHRISSSEVRTALAVGDLARAEHLLGRPFHISGHVIHGRKLGRQLGFPTMNLRVAPRCAARSGIYVVRVQGLGAGPMAGVASLGVRPSVEDAGRVLLEVHLLDESLDAYGKLVCVEFLHKLRDEEKFPDLPSLTAAIAEDARNARAYFAVHGL
ncbi:Riboflavin biosynthesis protein ribF [Bordetella pseudohinzii]|uniref:Riboflavin biosynthesis protein n=1 Tax=Bordetella pseudohinzii TaxID=1331258 RepID=A0A0M7BUF0_9BORD|nr:Riboflavin biosynthesis protein ribF [Bordetella pseudohinzii]